ncbi:MAG: hypothetical protein F6K19_27255 [Cyanothece sp. SIO1E1]|nr:hypothetical protein [Cyanothece sp. SIO1E1]
MLIASLPMVLLLLPMTHPRFFTIFSLAMLLSLGAALMRYQRQRSVKAYEGFIFWERLGMLSGVIGLLGTAPPW